MGDSARERTASDQDRSALIEAFAEELGLTLEPAEPGAWFPFNLRRGDAAIPCEAWTRLDALPGGATVESAIQRMAAIHSAGSPARAERVRAIDLLGQERYEYLVSVIGPQALAGIAQSAPDLTAPDAVTAVPSPSVHTAEEPPPSSPDAAALGESDGLVAAQAVGAVLLATYRPALLGALTLAAVALSAIPAGGYYETLGADAYGSDWPWLGTGHWSDESAYDKAFGQAVKSALQTEATLGDAVRELAAELQSPNPGSPGTVGILRWVAQFERRGQSAWEEEVRLSAERDASLARQRPAAWILPGPRRHGFFERGSVSSAYPSRVEQGPDGYVAVVTRGDVRREFFRATYGTAAEATAAADVVSSVCWQIGRLPHLAKLDDTLHMGTFIGKPFGRDVMEQLLRIADRVDRSERGYGLGEFSDCDTWDRIERGDVAGLLTRLATPPFGITA